MAEAYVVDVVRTAGGRRNGKLSLMHPAVMAGDVLYSLLDRTGIDPQVVEDVIMGCFTQAVEQGMAFGRYAVLASILLQTTPAVTIDVSAAVHSKCSSLLRRR